MHNFHMANDTHCKSPVVGYIDAPTEELKTNVSHKAKKGCCNSCSKPWDALARTKHQDKCDPQGQQNTLQFLRQTLEMLQWRN